MAADIHVIADAPARFAGSVDPALEAATAFAQTLRSRPPFEFAGGAVRRGDAVGVWTVPGVAGVDFRLVDGALSARADTHALGPGYATALAFRLRAFADGGRFVWRPADADGPEASEIERLSRELRFRRRAYAFPAPVAPLADHERAARETASALRRACRTAVERPNGAWPTRFGLPPEFLDAPSAPNRDAALLISTGPLDRADAARIAAAEAGAVGAGASDVLPWWRSGLGPETWLRLARAALWTAFDWAAPLSGAGRAAGRFVAHALREARPVRTPEIDAALDLDLFNAVMRADADGAPLFPTGDGVGYRRRARRWRAAGGWSVEAPGWCRRIDDGSVTRLSHWGFSVEVGAGAPSGACAAPSGWRRVSERCDGAWVRAAWRPDAPAAGRAARRAVASLAPWVEARAVC